MAPLRKEFVKTLVAIWPREAKRRRNGGEAEEEEILGDEQGGERSKSW